jgi:hypothetical protein
VDSVVLPCWQTGPDTVRMVRAARAALPSTVDVGAYVTVLPGSVEGTVGELRGAGAGELHLYHLGLAGPARLPELRAAVTAAT